MIKEVTENKLHKREVRQSWKRKENCLFPSIGPKHKVARLSKPDNVSSDHQIETRLSEIAQ